MKKTQRNLFPCKGTVRVGITAVVPTILREFGLDPAEVLESAGIDRNIFSDPENVISFSKRSHLFRLCVEKTGCDHFGLMVGQRTGITSLGLVGYFVRHSANVDLALRSLMRFFHLHAQGSLVDYVVKQGMASLSYRVYEPEVAARRQIEDGAVAIMLNTMHTLCGPEWCPEEVCFSHKKPANIKPYSRFFNAPLVFDAEWSGLLFQADCTKEPVIESDPELHRLLQEQIHQQDAAFGDSFPEQIVRVLPTALVTGHATINDIAQLFAMNSRTLSRHLKAHNTSFRELSDQVRFTIAKQMLEDSSKEIMQIAMALNYDDPSAFTRAFKRWSGATPKDWRNNKSL